MSIKMHKHICCCFYFPFTIQSPHLSFQVLFKPVRNLFYQSHLILPELFQHNLINVSYLTACYLYQVMMTLHFLNDVANTKIKKYVIIASLKCVLINRIPGARLLISSLPGSALRTHVESLGKPRDVNMRSQSLAW